MIVRRSVFLILACLFLPRWEPPLAAEPLARAQVVEAARRFCERIGAPVTGEATLTEPTIPGPPGIPGYWQPCWKVTFPERARLQIAAATGVVQQYDNDAHSFRLLTMPAGTCISAPRAIEIASAALLATGQSEQLSPPSAEWHTMGENGRASAHWWQVGWERLAQSVPYLCQGACVEVQPEDGVVHGLSLGMPSPPPNSMAINVSAPQAASGAERQLSVEGNADMVLDTVELRIVELQAAHVSPAVADVHNARSTANVPSTARLAWVHTAWGIGHYRTLWVDAASAEIIGGEDATSGGMPPVGGAAAEIAGALRGAGEIVVSGRGAWLEWVELAKLGAGTAGFNLATSASTPGAFPRPGLAPYKMGLGAGMTLYYFPEQNLLGTDGCWLQVSPQLAVLVKNLPVPAGPAPVKKP